MNTQRYLTKKEIMRVFLITSGVGLSLLIILAAFSTPQQPTKEVEGTKPELNLEIRYSRFEKGFSVPVITLKNLNDFEWQDCKVKLNDDYEKTMDAIQLPSTLSKFGSNDYHVIASLWFIKSDGTKFNPITTEPTKILVKCNEPYYSMEIYKFQN